MFTVIQEQTTGGCFNSQIQITEAEDFNRLTPMERENYLQENFYDNGHGEGAANLEALAGAIREFGASNVTTTIIYV